MICKSTGGECPTAQQLEKIAAYCRTKPKAEDVYIFSMILCDNAVDRDFECFTAEALETLANLFLGKTGIFDHNPKGANQTARIFNCRVEEDTEKRGAFGEPYRCVKADAYMIRCEKNRDLIREIEGGIKKEVSIGCAVGKAVCSICGADLKGKGCAHRPGETYPTWEGDACCVAILSDVKDAYEWSFVAVPAQRAAGVTQKRGNVPAYGEKVYAAGEAALLEKQAALGRLFAGELGERVIKALRLAQPDLEEAEAQILQKAFASLEAEELALLESAFRREANRRLPLTPQLAAKGGTGEAQGRLNQAFRI